MQIPRFARDDKVKMQVLRFAQDDNGRVGCEFLLGLCCVSAVKQPYVYIPITRSIALRHTAQNAICRVNIMQSTSGR
jgi:hypothetical protein